MRRRVAITGMGLISPLGRSLDEVWSGLLQCRSGIASLTLRSPTTPHELVIPAGLVQPDSITPPPASIRPLVDRSSHFAWIAATDALADSGLDVTTWDGERVGVTTGCCMNGISETDRGFQDLYVRNKRRVHPFTLVRTMPNASAALIAGCLGISGPALHYSTTCSSSSVAIGEAARLIRHGYADVMIAGGTEALLTYSAVNCWDSARLLAPTSSHVFDSCRPFDSTREGAVLSEGAAFVVLESWEFASRRTARIHAELIGYGTTADSGHPTQPTQAGQARSMASALADANVDPVQVHYIHAHGTATKLNDLVETRAVKQVFGPDSSRIPISSTKSMVGHMVGAAGSFGVIVAANAVARREIPPTAHLEHPDPECDLDYVPKVARRLDRLETAMTNAFGFGGTSATLLLKAA